MSVFGRSLRWRLVRNLIAAHALVIGLAGIVLFMVVMFFVLEDADGESPAFSAVAMTTLSEAVSHDAHGRLTLARTDSLQRLRDHSDRMWFIISDEHGNMLKEGDPPAGLAAYQKAIARIESANFLPLPSDPGAGRIYLQTFAGKGGSVKILFGGEGRIEPIAVSLLASSVLWQTLIIAGLVSLSTLLIVPFVVRRTLLTLRRTADEASRLNLANSENRLSEDDIPDEVVPVVTAVNHALDRLDTAMKKHQRFIADAAHELRTPVAILSTRLSALPSSPLKARLLEDAARLSSLAGQLLDIHRFESEELPLVPQDLVEIARSVVLDMAPLAFAAGYEVAFDADAEQVEVAVDRHSIERALANLVQNAINYGGRAGQITIRVSADRYIDVTDEGEGVPAADRERIFEAFQRGAKDGRGAGLGLDLVQQVMFRHGGQVALLDTAATGARFRLIFG